MAKSNLMLSALNGHAVDSFPIWIMRQAGRYLPEYRALRENIEFMQLCRSPNEICQASLMPIERFGFDAAIIFSDILVPLPPMGLSVTFADGPRIDRPIRRLDDVKALKTLNGKADLPYVYESIALLKQAVDNEIPIIGFAGGPFTIACYAVEGGSSTSFNQIREMMYRERRATSLLLEKLTDAVVQHLLSQIEAGAEVVQLFDTWAGLLTTKEYRHWILPLHQHIFREIAKTSVPSILFINGSAHLLKDMADSGATALSIDWRQDMKTVRQEVGDKVVLQGNLNPTVLFSPDLNDITQHTYNILNVFPDRRGLVFNLGHGIHPTTPVEAVAHLVSAVRNYKA